MDFFTADYWSSLIYESAEKTPTLPNLRLPISSVKKSPDLERDEHCEDYEADERREDLEGGEAEPPQQLVQLEEHLSPSLTLSLSVTSYSVPGHSVTGHSVPGLEILRWMAVLRRLSPRPRGL